MQGKHKELKEDEKKAIKVICVSVALLIIAILFSLNKPNNSEGNDKISQEKKLIGTWTTDGITIYEFEDAGKGRMIVPSSEYKFSYKIHDNEIYIDFEDDKAKDSDYEYSFEEEKLILKGIKQTTGTYTFTKK